MNVAHRVQGPPAHPARRHLRRWGAAYILAVLFLGSWIGQAVAQKGEIAEHGWSVFWSATFENWQSEWFQLLLQAVMLLGMKHWIFKADAEDLERIEGKLDRVLRREPEEPSGEDAGA